MVVEKGELVRWIDDKGFGFIKPNSTGPIKTINQNPHRPCKTRKTVVAEKHSQNDNSCPKCGKPMILRTARSVDNQGKQFWGCSGFPKCRTVRQIA
jgi:predicted RNA-binding Zn-ribbon protein involved in translation (DUF1610 family)